jgi:ArsR family transcriptional regulator, virulence genes transcriptional regulator
MRDDSLTAKVRLLANLSNEIRLELLSIIVEKEVSVGELAQILNVSQSSLSQHLARLRDDHLVSTRRDAQTIYYRCSDYGVRSVLNTLGEVFQSEIAGPQDVLRPARRTA